jgi:hypothetical protein
MILCVVSLAAAVRAADPDPVKVRLDTAQDAYRAEMKIYREKGTAWLEAREATARKGGDKKAVDRVHEEQRVFRTVSDLPTAAPPDLRQRPVDAKAKLVKAYTAAVKEWTKAGDDKAAAEVEKELGLIKAWKDISVTRRMWTHDRGEYHLTGKGRWEELLDGKICDHKWVEIDRTPEYVELQSTKDGRRYRIRISAESADYSVEPVNSVPLPTYIGKWVE